MITVYTVLVIGVSSLMILAGVAILAVGARAWSDAVAAQHRARAHGIEADMQRETIETARAAADRVMSGGRPPPTPEQIREAILQQRAAGNGEAGEYEEFTTSGDVTPDELNLHMQGGEFRQP